MNYKGPFPLFEKSDKEEAIEYLSSDLSNIFGDTVTGVTMVDGDSGEEYESFNGIPEEIRKSVTSNIVKAMYGENVHNIANFKIVQNIFLDKYHDFFLKYISLCGFNVMYSTIYPSLIANHYMKIKLNDTNFIPFERWNPNEYWSNYDYDPSNPRKNALNPINSLMHLTISIEAFSEEEKNKLINLRNNFDGILYGFMGENFETKILNINLLPAKNFFGIIQFKNGIEKFL